MRSSVAPAASASRRTSVALRPSRSFVNRQKGHLDVYEQRTSERGAGRAAAGLAHHAPRAHCGVRRQDRVCHLRGSVGSPAQRAAAAHTARKVSGVINVIDQLKVHPRVPDRGADDELRAAALQRLIDDTRVPANHVGVDVSGGRVTLKGYVWRDAERAAAAQQIAALDGVVEVSNQIEVK